MKLRVNRLIMVALALALAGGLLFPVGCAPSKISQENFDKVKIGMTQEEVQQILGPSTESSGIELPVFSGTMSKWLAGDTTISITFVNGKVIAKEFSKESKK
jgi:hypothetical protein